VDSAQPARIKGDLVFLAVKEHAEDVRLWDNGLHERGALVDTALPTRKTLCHSAISGPVEAALAPSLTAPIHFNQRRQGSPPGALLFPKQFG
jgi:hypothetical protein